MQVKKLSLNFLKVTEHVSRIFMCGRSPAVNASANIIPAPQGCKDYYNPRLLHHLLIMPYNFNKSMFSSFWTCIFINIIDHQKQHTMEIIIGYNV